MVFSTLISSIQKKKKEYKLIFVLRSFFIKKKATQNSFFFCSLSLCVSRKKKKLAKIRMRQLIY